MKFSNTTKLFIKTKIQIMKKLKQTIIVQNFLLNTENKIINSTK